MDRSLRKEASVEDGASGGHTSTSMQVPCISWPIPGGSCFDEGNPV